MGQGEPASYPGSAPSARRISGMAEPCMSASPVRMPPAPEGRSVNSRSEEGCVMCLVRGAADDDQMREPGVMRGAGDYQPALLSGVCRVVGSVTHAI